MRRWIAEMGIFGEGRDYGRDRFGVVAKCVALMVNKAGGFSSWWIGLKNMLYLENNCWDRGAISTVSISTTLDLIRSRIIAAK